MSSGGSSTRKRRAPVVAIDGPAGAGKSTVSRQVAAALGYTLLDTGALYRCVGLVAEQRGVTQDADAVSAVARELADTRAIRFDCAPGAEQRVFLAGRDVSAEIRSPEISSLASKVSAIPGVRAALLHVQRDVGREGRVVVEGRDIGSVVFPDAEAKFFLTASVHERATRRFAELKAKDPETSLRDVEAAVRERDRRDSNRPVAPLLQAADAELVDSTAMDVQAVVDRIVARVREVERSLAET